MLANKEKLDTILSGIKEDFSELKEEVKSDVVIGDALDDEAQRTPMLHAKYMGKLMDEGNNLSSLKTIQKKLYLERWKYYQGKQTDKYYSIHGCVNDKILKTDMDRYITSDDYICLIGEIVDYQKRVVEYLEKITKDISNRGYYIKDMVEWRRFTSGE